MKRNKDLPICSAYSCSNSGCIIRIIDDTKYMFCAEHTNVLDHVRSSVILELISSMQLDFSLLCSRFNFKNTGYTKDDLYNTIIYLLELGHIEINNGFFVTWQRINACHFPGCKLKRKTEAPYCLNHKKMPDLETIGKILDFIKIAPKSFRVIRSYIDIDPKVMRSLLFQLIKFGYAQKEKHGITNYYIKK